MPEPIPLQKPSQLRRLTRPGPTEARGAIGRHFGAQLSDVPNQPLPRQLALRLARLEALEEIRSDRRPPKL